MPTIDRAKTAMSRTDISRPVQQALEDGLLDEGRQLFDYGCGRGDDVRFLNALGLNATGWDPAHAPDGNRSSANVVNLGYVLNVIEDPTERADVLRSAWRLADDVLVASARLNWDRDKETGTPYSDGVLTSASTFQKYYDPSEFQAFVTQTLGVPAITAAPGIVYVFRHNQLAQQLIARHARRGGAPRQGVAQLLYQRHSELLTELETFLDERRKVPTPIQLTTAEDLAAVFGSIPAAFAVLRKSSKPDRWTDITPPSSRRVSEARFAENLDVLQPLLDFLDERGRLPRTGELDTEDTLTEVFGSVRRAFALVRRATGREHWSEAADRAKENFLVYAALSAFGGRPRLSDLAEDLQFDAKDLFGNYKAACEQADQLLFSIGDLDALSDACANSELGKLTPTALYVHTSAVARLAPVLRVYVGAAKVITGNVDDATLVKLHRSKPQVSFLAYPTFDTDPHPALEASVIGRLGQIRLTHRYFGDSDNPPILHRKDSFVPSDYPGHSKFARLTRQEERAGILDRPDIGRQKDWQELLRTEGLRLQGHRLSQLGT